MHVSKDKRRGVSILLPLIIILLVSITISTSARAEQLIARANGNLYPYAYLDKGQPKGIVVEIARAAFDAQGLDVQIQLGNWGEQQSLVKSGDGDLLLHINPTDSRLEWLAFSDPFVESEMAIFFLNGSYNSLDALNNKRVGVEAKGFPFDILSTKTRADIQVVNSWSEGFEQLAEGSLDAILVDRWVGLSVAKDLELSTINSSLLGFEHNYSQIAVPKAKAGLLDEINKGLNAIRQNGTYGRIMETWASEKIVYITEGEHEAMATQRVLLVIVCVLLLLFGIVVWNLIRARRRIRQWTAELESRLDDKTRALRSALNEQQVINDHLALEQQVNSLAISVANLVVYEIDVATGFATVINGTSPWPELWETKPFINVLGDVLPEADRAALKQAMDRPGEVCELQIRHPVTGEPVYWGQFSFTEIQEFEGRRVQIGSRLITDSLVRARKDAETALTRLNDTASGGRIGLFRHNLGDDTVECNDVYRDLYALPKSEFPKLTLALADSRLDPSTRSEQTFDRSAARLTSEQTKYERTLLLPDGTRRHIYIFAKPEYENGEVVAMIGSAFDITAERNAQEGLSQANSSLSELLQKQRELFAVVGHELRTPVASIQMLIQDEDYSADEKVSAIDEITHNLLNVLEDMRIVVAPERANESREVYASPIDVIRRAASPLTSLVREKGLSLELCLPEAADIRFFFSDQAMRQLVTNLVKNAAIHSHGTRVRVSLDYDDISEAIQTVKAVLRVEDDGNGLAEGSVEKMFEAFARGDSKANGSGLGLFIAQGLATELGGILEYERSELGGACFTLRLILTREHTEAQAQAQAQAHSISLDGLRILLAEDEAMLRMLSEKMLTKLGALVSGYENGKRALDAFDPAEFDLVLTDLMMPEMDGYALTTALRKSGATMPIIAVTAAVIGDETDQVLQAGADGVISKPITPEKLIEALNAVNKEVKCG